MTASNDDIGLFIQIKLRTEDLDEVAAVKAAEWLEAAELLSDSRTRPGKPLRNRLRAGEIAGSEQRPATKNGRWFIRRL